MRPLLAGSLLLVACASSPALPRDSPPPEPEPEPCPAQAEIDAHMQESSRLSEQAQQMREELEAARRELDEASDEETRAAVQAEIEELEGGVGYFFGRADEHYFAAKRLQEECDALTSRDP